MGDFFIVDQRLGIPIPELDKEWEEYSEKIRLQILFRWEIIRGSIPDRIADLEKEINVKQAELFDENDFNRSCDLNTEIAELASIINDLWLWFRTNQDLSDKVHH